MRNPHYKAHEKYIEAFQAEKLSDLHTHNIILDGEHLSNSSKLKSN